MKYFTGDVFQGRIPLLGSGPDSIPRQYMASFGIKFQRLQSVRQLTKEIQIGSLPSKSSERLHQLLRPYSRRSTPPRT